MIDAIILAAGQGTRMKSNKAKVLHQLGGKSLLQHVVDAIKPLSSSINIVIGNDAELVKNSINNHSINWVLQKKQLGTGHAVQQATSNINGEATCVILYGDVPLFSTNTIKSLISKSESTGFSLLSVILDNPTGYGRIIRDKNKLIKAIVEDKDTNRQEQKIDEINTGIMAIQGSLLKKYITQLETDNSQGELYLTDIVKIAVKDSVTISSLVCDNVSEVMGINDKNQLAEAERIYQQQQAKDMMSNGLTIKDPSRFDCRGNLIFGKDCSVDINVVFEGENELGENVLIAPNCIIKNAKIGDHAEIKANTIIDNAVIGSHATVGPFARIRPETKVGNNARIGNFVEVKKSSIDDGSKVPHLSYVGDSTIGQNVNVGAGVITCNYDGVNKHQTIIKNGAFIGSDTQLIAPVTVGENATIGAGSTITQDVPGEKLTLSRKKQTTIPNWKRKK
ncbi:MAG: bifunctional UDP-N-acetylglucosamine diphosphorylase/glucosamine-1-phosphate N-acetyltransferase GlmU [Candidatus Thioglobus sp.]|jgi:bifunctional UDP-N-acetylglucosamine pyrophosphorylase/glucosamine-1-phosphate N-acetyltransferase|nr:bifunctional UDP-N-acetylglucosamine diphosphorylase/glucosamine-1-phosphate N-acetyltransferase GlmU [Candidatus Thioglobus sp.]|tara:strand:+ start:2483 stop:3832 length:1350 start_codon:yes stop_codon:yes gene_type:complete